VQGVSTSADGGWPFVLSSAKSVQETNGIGGVVWTESMMRIASSVVSALDIFKSSP
jgi:ATP-binding protein involved in chromosome partitioning